MKSIAQTEIDIIQSTIKADIARYQHTKSRQVTIAILNDMHGIGMTTLARHLMQNTYRHPHN